MIDLSDPHYIPVQASGETTEDPEGITIRDEELVDLLSLIESGEKSSALSGDSRQSYLCYRLRQRIEGRLTKTWSYDTLMGQ